MVEDDAQVGASPVGLDNGSAYPQPKTTQKPQTRLVVNREVELSLIGKRVDALQLAASSLKSMGCSRFSIVLESPFGFLARQLQLVKKRESMVFNSILRSWAPQAAAALVIPTNCGLEKGASHSGFRDTSIELGAL